MNYCFQLLPHTNSLYRDAQKSLAKAELTAILKKHGIETDVVLETIGGCSFLSFDAPILTEQTVAALSLHSSFLMLCEKDGDLLRPFTPAVAPHIPYEISEYLKYKGKTNATFTRMLINLADSVRKSCSGPVTVLDPLCGKGTTLLCALSMQMNAVGVDLDQRDVKDCCDFFTRYCETQRYKLSRKDSGFTCGKKSVPCVDFTTALDKEALKLGNTQSMKLFLADTAMSASLLKRSPADLLVADLPYGVQHAPQAGTSAQSFTAWLSRVLPVWHDALRIGSGAAIAFNIHTIPRETLAAEVSKAGFTVLAEPPYQDFRHFVETSVLRDVIVCVRS